MSSYAARAAPGRRRADQRLEIVIAIADRMAKERDLRRIASDPASAFDDHGDALVDRLAQVAATVVTVQELQLF